MARTEKAKVMITIAGMKFLMKTDQKTSICSLVISRPGVVLYAFIVIYLLLIEIILLCLIIYMGHFDTSTILGFATGLLGWYKMSTRVFPLLYLFNKPILCYDLNTKYVTFYKYKYFDFYCFEQNDLGIKLEKNIKFLISAVKGEREEKTYDFIVCDGKQEFTVARGNYFDICKLPIFINYLQIMCAGKNTDGQEHKLQIVCE